MIWRKVNSERVKRTRENLEKKDLKAKRSLHAIFRTFRERMDSFLLISRRLHPFGLLFRYGVYAGCLALFLMPPFVFFPEFWPVTVATSHQALQRDYYHTVLFVLWGRRHSNKSRNSLLLNHITNFSYLFLYAFWLRTNLTRILLDIV